MEREHRLYQEQQRQLREQAEQAERERQAAIAAKEEAERARLNFEREERERRLREKEEHKHQEEERRNKREREQREQREKRDRDELEKRSQHSSGWLGKRSHQDSGSSGSGYGSTKRPALHGSSDNYGTVFSRLDPQTQQKAIEPKIQPLMSTHVDSFRRPSDHRSTHSGGGNIYAKAMSGGLTQTVRAPTTDLSPELISAATQALENLRKSVHSGMGNPLSMQKPMQHMNVMNAHAQLQQLAAASGASATLSAASRIPASSMVPSMSSRSSLDLHHQTGSMLRPPGIGNQGSGSGGMGASAYSGMHGKGAQHYGASSAGASKLPPEEERYNRRYGGRHQSSGRPGYKGRMN